MPYVTMCGFDKYLIISVVWWAALDLFLFFLNTEKTVNEVEGVERT